MPLRKQRARHSPYAQRRHISFTKFVYTLIMFRVLRITLMWLIALAVPIQGSAAASMFGCGPGHHGGMGSSQVAVNQKPASDVDRVSRGAMDEDADSLHHEDGIPHNHAHSLKSHGATHKAAKGSCTPCASCCVAAALPATMIQFEPASVADVFVLSAQGNVSSFLADGLERPPRHFLA